MKIGKYMLTAIFAVLMMVIGLVGSAKATDGECSVGGFNSTPNNTAVSGHIRSFSHYYGGYIDVGGNDVYDPHIYHPFTYFDYTTNTTAPVHQFYVVARRTSTGSIYRNDGSLQLQSSAGDGMNNPGEGYFSITNLLPCTDYTLEAWHTQPMTGQPDIIHRGFYDTVNTSDYRSSQMRFTLTFPNQ